MTVRKRKKKNKLRGHRTHGKGDTKRKRGAGSRGGRGRAGSHKHKYSIYYKDFGGKIKLKPKKKGIALNLKDVKKELLKKEGAYYLLDGKKLKIAKILGRGTINFKLKVRNVALTKVAREKIQKAGGIVEEEKGE